MWIKICGITTLEDAELAIDAGADALGFIFAESPRRVTPETVRRIVEQLSRPVERIGVFVETPPVEMAEVAQQAGLTGVQLHGDSAKRLLDSVMPTSLKKTPVVRYTGDAAALATQLRAIRTGGAGKADQRVLVDTGVAGKHGGTGQVFDWVAAQEAFAEAAGLELIAAGGLRPENVAEAIRVLRPWGVDVSSGVEASPGRKDAARVKAFVAEARRAQ